LYLTAQDREVIPKDLQNMQVLFFYHGGTCHHYGRCRMASLKKRGKRYYEQYYVGKKQVTKSLGTSSLQIAKEKLRQHESARFRGEEAVMPTRTPIPQVVGAFVRNMRGKKRLRNVVRNTIT
jgi:hypothetical protein